VRGVRAAEALTTRGGEPCALITAAKSRRRRRRRDTAVNGSQVVDNPSTVSIGITSLGLPWMLGGHEYGGSIDQIFHGWIGDVRIVNRPLSIDDFMTGK
jgi:hypothetical protein